ncbi:hypothetical protein SELMODRAFT_404413 [Selaginella moellendorffii]|uniref:Uncharacterized protein n=1 Tax=Selaginella moellendorffii TaxID=88036 RepID=D8QV89_SELML|nr:hypothetical protein SELMODRAFT_404413 [Selaginella moellendorffii]
MESNAQTHLYAQNGTLDFLGQPALKKETGNWTGAIPMICQVSPTVCKAFSVLTLLVCCSHPILGAFLSDTYWGRYRTLLYSFVLYGVVEATTSFVSFGADQFDNFIVWGIHIGGLVSVTMIVYIEDHVGFSWGFGLLGLILAVSIALFLIQTTRYRYRRPEGSPLTKMVQVTVAAFSKRNVVAPSLKNSRLPKGKDTFHTLTSSVRHLPPPRNGYGQPAWKHHPASNLTVVLFLPLYDRIIVPTIRKFSGNERGITLLQRSGLGIFIAAIGLGIAALMEIKRKAWMNPTTTVTIFWLVPHYVVLGIAEGLTNSSQLEFFHEQSPDTFHSLGTSLALANLGVGSFLSIPCVNRAAPSWLRNGVNSGHLERYYWLILGLSLVNLAIFVPVARWYSYKSPDP